jgi:hypothetical protein
MKIKCYKKNLNLITNNYVGLLFSYETPVAGYNQHIGFFKTKKFWLAAFTQDNEDDPLMIVRVELPRKSTESAIKLAVKAGKKWMDTDDMVWEILIHDGPTQVPATGDAILARLSREQFNESMELIIND